MNIGVIGAGAIATYVLETAAEDSSINVESVLVRDKEKYAGIAARYGVTLYTDVEDFLASNIDIVVEAANVSAVEMLLPTILCKKSALIISIGAFVDETFTVRMKEKAAHYNHQLLLPSGAIGGLDLIQHTANTNTLESVTIETRKPAYTLTEEPLEKEKVIFQDNAKEAIKQFPKNINVAIALGMAGIGMERTNVTIIADPMIERNMHTIIASGAFGKVRFHVENAPMPTNANTSYLAALSVIGTLKKSHQAFQLG